MKRALIFIIALAVCIGGLFFVKGAAPFLPVFGTSMEPALRAGDLIIIEEVSPSEVKEGDIIVFSVPAQVREYYDYPEVVAHRVIEVSTEPTLSFRTKGDNTSEDPFAVRAQDVRGRVGQQIPYLGFSLLFLQSQQGITTMIVALFLLVLFLYGGDLARGTKKMQRGALAPVIEESQRREQVIAQRLKGTEQKIEGTQQALNSFASAMGEYAQHLASHTAAVKDLASASQDLRNTAREQSQFFSRSQEVPVRKEVKVRTVKPVPGCYLQKNRVAASENKRECPDDAIRHSKASFLEAIRAQLDRSP